MIYKNFEVIKCYIIILSVDCNTHSHTLSKKQKDLWMFSLSAKTKGRRGRSPGGGKTQFFGKTEISGWWGGERFHNLAGWEKLFCLDGIFNNFLFESKTKKLCNFKSWSIRNLWKSWLPPLWNESSHKGTFQYDVIMVRWVGSLKMLNLWWQWWQVGKWWGLTIFLMTNDDLLKAVHSVNKKRSFVFLSFFWVIKTSWFWSLVLDFGSKWKKRFPFDSKKQQLLSLLVCWLY